MKQRILQIILVFFTLTSFGQSHRLAILDLCERNEEVNKENLASAIHMAEVAGMPYFITSIVSEATEVPFILITSSLRDETLQTSEIQTLTDFVNQGGILVAPYIRNSIYFSLFGISSSSYASTRYSLKWESSQLYPELQWVNEDLEKELPLADPEYDRSIYTRGYTPENASVLASFEDNLAAITKNNYGQGKAYALGFELKDVILRNLLNKDYSTQRTWSNGFEPTTDMFLLFLRAIYTSNQPVSIYKHTSPGNSTSVLLLTHDVDSQTGVDSMFYFSEWEANEGIKAHYFITTRYFSDGLMSDYYKEEDFDKMKNLLRNGHKIGSHSVGHFTDFANMTTFPIGETGNTKENYNPAYHDGVTVGGTVTGELEVSRDLLNSDIGANVRSYRSGYLAFNLRLTNVLADLGFAFNSTHSANDVLTNFPYRQRTNSAFSGSPTEVYEMPMTISDASKSIAFSEETYDQVVALWLDVLNKNNDNNAPTVLLIHPNRGWKLEAQKLFIADKPSSVITFEFDAFGDYWLERRDLDFDYSIVENTLKIQLANDNPIGEEQSMIIGNGANLEKIEVLNASGELLEIQQDTWKQNDIIISRIGSSVIPDPDPDPKQYSLIIHSKDENAQDLSDVNWQVLSADSTLIGVGNTGLNALDTLQFSNENSTLDLIVKTYKSEYTDFRVELIIEAEQEVQISTLNELIKYQYSLEVSAKDSETEVTLDSIHVKAFLNESLLMQGESLENTIAQLETTQAGHQLEIDIIIDRKGYPPSDSISITLEEGEDNQLIVNLIKEDNPEPDPDPVVIDLESRLAILDLCDRNGETNKENLASVKQMADVAGIPYFITSVTEEACENGFILLSSEIDELTLSSIELESLIKWVDDGGVLIAPFVKNPELFELFGIESSKLIRYRYELNWSADDTFSELKWIDDPMEKSIPLADPSYYKSIYTRGYALSTAQALAEFEDNSIAVCKNSYGNGKAYAFGVEWKDVILRNLLDKDYNAQRSYSNNFEPTTDVFMLMLRAIFTENQDVAVYKHTSPAQSTSTLLITHDVDSRTIISTMNYFSNWEFIQNLSAHYFVATHYFKDSYMSAYYEEANFDKLSELIERNHTIGSHSVTHAPDFYKTSVFPLGSAGNTQFNYNPSYDGSATTGGTVYGELEVSRNLLNADINANVRSFRAGALSLNPLISNVMEELGYTFNSSMSANNVLTNFPYFQRTKKAFSGRQTTILELPLTLTDGSSENKLVETNIDEVVNHWTDVIIRNNRNNAPSVLLISPNREWKLGALESLIGNLPSGVITYNFEDYGDYWLDRNELDFDYTFEEGVLSIQLKSDITPAEDLSLIIENGINVSQIDITNSSGQNIAFYTKSWNTNDRIITFGQEAQSVRFKNTATIDIPSLVEESQFNLFPNPAKGFVNLLIDMELEEEYNIRVMDLNGRLISSYGGISAIGSSIHRIDLVSFSKGIYLINFESASIKKTFKLPIVD